ncbi:MAG: peptidylprolyl isomerase [Nitrospirota bacterium]|jgi:cyclophilin family peptidyl-prolyl cis-trans isomerase
MGISLRLSVVAVAALWLAGCHESADTSVEGSAHVPATGGGTQQIALPPTGDVAVTLTEGAVAEDTTVTLAAVDREVPAGLGILSKVIRIGPTDLTLQTAATLTFNNYAAVAPEGTDPANLTMAFLGDDGVLERIEASPFFGSLIGSIGHFGDVVLVELQPRTVTLTATEDPVVGQVLQTVSAAVGSQVAGENARGSYTIEFETDVGDLSASSASASAGLPATVRLTSPETTRATVTATVADSVISNFAEVQVAGRQVRVETSMGDFTLDLFPLDAPGHVANFLNYVETGRYDGTLIHRVVDGFVIQGGGFLPGGGSVDRDPPIASEADNGLSNQRGTLSLALGSEGGVTNPQSGTSEFFVNLGDNSRLDPDFTVFGKVVEGMDVVDAIAALEVPGTETPREEVVVTDAFVVTE